MIADDLFDELSDTECPVRAKVIKEEDILRAQMIAQRNDLHKHVEDIYDSHGGSWEYASLTIKFLNEKYS